MGLIDDIKNQVKKSGTNKAKFLYFKPGVKNRVRFLTDMDEGLKVLFHDSFTLGVNVPCQEIFDKMCKHCDNDELRHRDQYMWSVWDYEAKEVKILMGAVNQCSCIPALVGMYDVYGTLVDRDYVITKNGQSKDATFSVVPMDKVRFRNEKAKPFSESKMLSLLNKAFPDDESDDDVEDDEVETKAEKRRRQVKAKKAAAKAVEQDDEDEEEDEEPAPKKKKAAKKHKPEPVEEEEDDEEEDEESEYDDMSAIELYKLCKKKKIQVAPKKSEKYYIIKLEAADSEEEDEEDEEW